MALYLIKDLDDDYHSKLGVWQVSETEEELRALASVPSDELEEISYIKKESLRKQKLAVRTLLDCLFEEKVYLNHHDNGKPYIENSSINISITHTDKYVAVLINDTEEVGIDCESLDRDFSAVEQRALSADEIEDLDEEQRNEQLAIYWCAKEAINKKMSQYNVDYAGQIEIENFRVKGEGELEAVFTRKDGFEEQIHLQYITFDRHVIVWVSTV